MEARSNAKLKQAACIVCRRGKNKCESDPGSAKCRRCIQMHSQCVKPVFQLGRQKGIKNKRRGLDNALHQIEQAVKRARAGAPTAAEDRMIRSLQALLVNGTLDTAPAPAPGLSGEASTTAPLRGSTPPATSSDQTPYVHPTDPDDSDTDAGSDVSREGSALGDSLAVMGDGRLTVVSDGGLAMVDDGGLAVDGAENPLQLLARASNLLEESTPQDGSHHTMLPRPPPVLNGQLPGVGDQQEDQVKAFFTAIRVDLDIGEDIDPMSLGLVTQEEAESLFAFFYDNLLHTRWGLDPLLHDIAFTRSRSAFLFTSILAASALFIPSAGALSQRLSNHRNTLAARVVSHRSRSVEIVLAYMINVPWMFPGKNSTDDETGWFLSMATTVAMDLSLHKVVGRPCGPRVDIGPLVARGERIEAQTALALDGFADVDPSSAFGRRLLRRRERAWIALFVLERGVCLARGRSYTVPVTALIKECDTWHFSGAAHRMDGHMISMAVLRRNLDDLFARVRSLCDAFANRPTDGSLTAQSIQVVIENFFRGWHATWDREIGFGEKHTLPPYVDILVTHTLLSTYSSVINHPTAPVEVRRFFHAAGLSSALSVMRVAIQGESQLMSMPNNTAIMISFAACFALRLSARISGPYSIAPSIQALIEETADLLERIGSVTAHRHGMSTMYGRYLRDVVRKVKMASQVPEPLPPLIPLPPLPPGSDAFPLEPTTTSMPQLQPQLQPQLPPQLPPQPPPQMETGGFIAPAPCVATGPEYAEPVVLWLGQEQIPFSTMSDNQIRETLSSATNDLDVSIGTFPWDDLASLSWMNWPNLPDFTYFGLDMPSQQ